jgi:hypothetical protein
MLRDHILDLLIWLIGVVETHKHRMLARKLHRLADTYDPRPSGEWGE